MQNMKQINFKRQILMLTCLMMASSIYAQSQLKITGVVTDENDEPMIAVSVVEKGTANGIVTDIDGRYALSVTSGATIVYSYLGYITQEHPATGQSMNIVLKEDTQILDEVVVIGYGVQKKSNVTGAISSIKSDDLLNVPVSNAASALQGKVSGVQVVNNSGAPGVSPTIRIRGYSSNGVSDPLYVVDGLKVSSLDYLEPSSIESIEILKDAASAAIYGAEAGNGVILVTTKSGKKGTTLITFDAQFTHSSLAKKMDVMNAKEYINYYSEANASFPTMLNLYYYEPSSFINGKLADTDWQDETFVTGKIQKYSLGLQGGNSNGDFYLSMGYMDNDGILKGSADFYKRFTSQINASYKLRKWMEVGTNNSLYYSMYNQVSEGQTEYGVLRRIYQIDPLTPVEYINGLPGWIQSSIAGGAHPVQNPETGNYYGISWANGNPASPLMEIERDQSKNHSFSINGTTYLNLKPFDNFVFTSRLGYNFGNLSTHIYVIPSIYSFGEAKDNDLLMASLQLTTRFYQWENFANYNFNLAGGDFAVMAGMSYKDSESDYIYNKTNEIAGDKPNFRYMDYSTQNAVDVVKGYLTIRRQIAYYGRLSWSYLDRYNFQTNFRADSYDASFLDLNHSWGYFPSVSAGWTASNEEFMKDVNPKTLSYAKLRISYGKNGSISNLGGYMYASTLKSGATDWLGYTIANNSYWMDDKLCIGTYPSEYLANPKLRWEESTQFDLGVDLRFLNHRLLLTADYYNKLTDGLLVNSDAPLITGTTSVYQNLGKIRNTGVELELEWKDRIGKDFGYSLKANIGTVSNKVTKYLGKNTRIGGTAIQSSSGALSYFEEGYPLWYLRGYQIEKIDPETGVAIYKDTDGVEGITDADKTDLGNGIPNFTYGATISLSYKDFDFLIYGAGTQGSKLFYGVTNAGAYWYNKPAFLYANRWTSTNTSASLPSPLYQTDERFFNSDAFVFDASFFKIKQIQLGYTLPKSFLDKISITSLRAFVSLDNFFTFTSYPGNDPEVRSTTSGSMAIDVGGYPIAKSVSFGFNISF
jgi:TonB-linked SusC/RagA family outer membrane protein